MIITCTLTHRVGAYYLGRGSYWVTDFVDDLQAGKFGKPARARYARPHELRGERQYDRFGNHFRRCVEDRAVDNWT